MSYINFEDSSDLDGDGTTDYNEVDRDGDGGRGESHRNHWVYFWKSLQCVYTIFVTCFWKSLQHSYIVQHIVTIKHSRLKSI